MSTGLLIYFLKRGAPCMGGQPGILYDSDNKTLLCHTMELPWDANQPNVSCIPAGEYEVQPYSSARHPNVWEVTNVPGRTAILIHNGNTEEDSLGCILVGQSAGELDGEPAVLNSDACLDMLRGIWKDNFILHIS